MVRISAPRAVSCTEIDERAFRRASNAGGKDVINSAQRFARENYNWEKIVDQYEQLFEGMFR